MQFLSGKPFKKLSKGSGLLHWAALNQSDLCQVYLSRKQSVFGLEQWQCIHTFFFLAQYKLCLLFKTPSKRVKYRWEEAETHRAEPWLIGLLWCREKANPSLRASSQGSSILFSVTIWQSSIQAVPLLYWHVCDDGPSGERLCKSVCISPKKRRCHSTFHVRVSSVYFAARMKVVYVTSDVCIHVSRWVPCVQPNSCE